MTITRPHNPPRTPHTAVAGLQWGDEGKGKIVDLLTADHDVIVRYNGGANAGHTVVVGDQKYSLHLIPAGILSPDKTCVIANGVVVDPEKLVEEIEGLRGRGIEVGDNLRVSDRAHVVMPYHKEHDAALERVLSQAIGGSGDHSIGTTRRGIGPAYADKVHRSTALRVGDLLDPDRLRSKLRVICAVRSRELEALGVSAPPLDPAELAERAEALGRRIAGHVTDSTYLLHDCVAEGRSLLFEGANACLLDIDHGTYPYVTSSNCSTLGISAGTGLPGIPSAGVDRVLGIMKAYATRVGAGPFPTELGQCEIGDRIRERGHEYGTTTGRPRRCGWLDLVAVRYSAMVCGATEPGVHAAGRSLGPRRAEAVRGLPADPTAPSTDRFLPDADCGSTGHGADLRDAAGVAGGSPRGDRSVGDAARQRRNAISSVIESDHRACPVEIISVGPERMPDAASRFEPLRPAVAAHRCNGHPALPNHRRPSGSVPQYQDRGRTGRHPAGYDSGAQHVDVRSRTEPVSSDLDVLPEHRPRHIAIIMDGNGRWAESAGRAAHRRPPRGRAGRVRDVVIHRARGSGLEAADPLLLLAGELEAAAGGDRGAHAVAAGVPRSASGRSSSTTTSSSCSSVGARACPKPCSPAELDQTDRGDERRAPGSTCAWR